MIHHNTIRKYVAALLDTFNDIEVQYTLSDGTVKSRNVPIKYSSKEKSHEFDNHTTQQLLSGNYNILPRANIALSTLAKADSRVTNKNLKINTAASEEKFEYMYNSVPYTFTFELTVQCRGMNEATMIIEQIAPLFNPTINIDIWDGENLNEPTRIPVKLLDIGIETEEYEELSSNIVTINFGIELTGNFYQPIKEIHRIKKFKMLINETPGDGYFDRKSILGWDVEDDGTLQNGEIVSVDYTEKFPPSILSINVSNLSVGENEFFVLFDDKDNKLNELNFEWNVIYGGATIISKDLDKCIVNVESDFELEVVITDIYGNYSSLSREFIL